jgi:hypothetical protein
VPVKVEAGLLALPKLPPVPLIFVQTPVPIVGVFAAKVTVVKPQVAALVWSGPALAVVGFWLKVTFTSSVEAVQGELEIVHRSTYAVPAVPVKVVFRTAGSAKLPPVPLTTLHIPVPTLGLLPFNVTCVKPQVAKLVWSAPALAVVGFWLKVTVISSKEAVQGELEIVHRNT